ncbi:hypothetical protein [Kitasatospora acidiphila]|uniref:hypothetical protein n=1 Tax=Kitasatospora acidiphila TaxID=2567942 RepID=UPI003C73C96F
MSITTARPDAPADETPTPVDLTKRQPVGDGDQAVEEAAAGWVAALTDRIRERLAADGAVREHLQRARANTWRWLRTEDLTDGQLSLQVIAERQRHHQQRETHLKRELASISSQIIAAKRSETADTQHNDYHRDGEEVALLKGRRELIEAKLAELHHQVETIGLAPTEAQLSRARWGRQLTRGAALVGSVVGGGIVLPVESSPLWLLAALPAAAVALWRAGLVVEEQHDQEQAPVGAGSGSVVTALAEQPIEQPIEGPAFAAAVMAAREAAAEASTPGAVAARQVAEAAEQAAQIQGGADLINALVKAKIIDKAEVEETSIVGVIRPDGPGWTATIELPGGRPAEQAIGRDAELASALRVKSAQLQMSKDVSEEGHEGRFVIWVANTANPYAGAPVPSELIKADRWDFWQQGIPLGTNARGVRKILNMLWSSLLIGGLMGFGKSYLARLVAAAAVLDPYLKIVLLSGKSGADWAALKLVAHRYVSGNTPAVIRDMHRVMEETIEEMAQHGERLEKLFETDPKSCPEGKITPELAKQEGLEMTLLLVEELQEILDAAAAMKLVSADDAEAAAESEGGRKPAGRNGKEVMVSMFARFMRVARYVGGMAVIITQRPDSNSVPTELREVASKRACYRVKGQNSSKMVLGEDAVAAGAAPHLLLDQHKGVTVLDEGAEEGHDTVKADVINLDDFRVICERGRDLRIKAGTLTGQAAERWEKERVGIRKRQVIADAIAAMDANGVDRARLVVLAEWMAELSPERWHDLTETTLGALLRDADAGTTTRIGAVDGLAKASGYMRDQLAAALERQAAA